MQEYTKIDQRIHLLCQPIAKASRTYVAPKEDDSHTNIFFDPVSTRIYGRWITSKNTPLILALNLGQSCFEWVNNSLQVLQSIPFVGKNIRALEQAISETLPKMGLDENGFTNKLHFEIPEYDFVTDPFMQFDGRVQQTWMAYRQLANSACYSVLDYLQVPGEVRIWPHHFDTGTYAEPNQDVGIGFGMAMEDTMVGAPYFYLSGYSLNDQPFNYQHVGDLEYGHWEISENWKGAVLSLDSLATMDTATQIRQLSVFIKQVATWFLTQ